MACCYEHGFRTVFQNRRHAAAGPVEFVGAAAAVAAVVAAAHQRSADGSVRAAAVGAAAYKCFI